MNQSQYIKKYSKGTVMIREGDIGSEMYLLLSGSAGMYKSDARQSQVLTATLGPGNFFGERSLFLGKPHLSTVMAFEEILTLTITKQNALDVFGKHPDLVHSILGEMCNRIDAQNKSYEELYLAHYGIPVSPVEAEYTSATQPAAAQPAEKVSAAQSTPAKTPSTQSPAAPKPSKGSSLFPEKHGTYTLPSLTSENDCLYLEKFTCPLCKSKFESFIVLTSRLRRAGSDRDLRIRYADIEPLYYDIVSCPNCLYSASNDSFGTAARSSLERINKEFGKYKSEVQIKAGSERDTFTVFAGYYLALLCAPICFDNHQMINAGLWRKLAGLYKDCDDDLMFLYTSEKALQEYNYVYERFDLSDGQMQQVCYRLGDLHERLGDFAKARSFFFMTKTSPGGTRNMRDAAENRLEDLKELMKES